MAKYKLHPSITEQRITRAVMRYAVSLDDPGFCLACGLEHYGIEPDARRYPCESCGVKAVFGAEEIMVMHFYWPAPRPEVTRTNEQAR